MKINTIRDLHREIARQAESLDSSCYELSFDELVERVAEDFLATARQNYNFVWGDEFPVMDERVFWNLFTPYEIPWTPAWKYKETY